MSDRCDQEVFKHGQPLLLADTGLTGGAKTFEVWVQRIAAESGQRVDWHYSGDIAQVLVLGDWQRARDTAERLVPELAEDQRVMRWFEPDDAGAYRAGVTEVPDDVIAGFTGPDGEQYYVRGSDD